MIDLVFIKLLQLAPFDIVVNDLKNLITIKLSKFVGLFDKPKKLILANFSRKRLYWKDTAV